MVNPVGIVAGGVVGHSVGSLLDKKKGDMSNRVDCAKEHLKNELGAATKVGLAGLAYHVAKKPGPLTTVSVLTPLGGMTVPFRKPSILTSASMFIGDLLHRGITALKGGKLGKIGNAIANSKIGQTILKTPTKAGKYAILGTGAFFIIKTIGDAIMKAGRIDQKHEDIAEVERAISSPIFIDPFIDRTPPKNAPKLTPDGKKIFYDIENK